MEKINDTEMKARFFAQYLNQRVLKATIVEDILILNTTTLNDYHDGDCLLLKPPSLISDEDAIAIGFNSGESARTTFLKSLGALRVEADYLRSKGYALPFMDMSVEQLVSMNWIKLTES